MRYFVTADMHFDHHNQKGTGIIDYCNRPFKDIEHMNEELVRRFNERVKPEDTCFFLGDFAFKSAGGKKAYEYLVQLNGGKVMIRGNHDNNNSVKAIISQLVVNYGKFKIGMIHEPQYIERVDFVLCGHVHHNWKSQDINGKLLINVGVDVWDFYPVRLDEILKFRNKIVRGEK